MPSFIVKLQDYYFEYSTIVDAPVTFGLPLDEFKKYYREEYGQQGIDNLGPRLERVEKYGSSQIGGIAADDVLLWNRAGPDEVELTPDEIYQAYCLRESIRDGWKPT